LQRSKKRIRGGVAPADGSFAARHYTSVASASLD
jgi:hypothetical protein